MNKNLWGLMVYFTQTGIAQLHINLLDGRRIRITHKNVTNLCDEYYGGHIRKSCVH